MFGCLVGWLLACLLGCLVGSLVCWLRGWHQTSPKSSKKGSKILPKSIKLGVKIVYDRSQEASWGGLGRSWAQDGPKRAPIAKMYKKPKHFHPLLEAKLEPKSSKNRSWGDPKGDHFFDRFWDRFLDRFWYENGSQNRPKINQKSIQDAIIFLIGCWIDFLMIF